MKLVLTILMSIFVTSMLLSWVFDHQKQEIERGALKHAATVRQQRIDEAAKELEEK